MKKFKSFIYLLAIFIIPLGIVFIVNASLSLIPQNESAQNKPFVIAVHGGAGYLQKQNLSEENKKLYESKLSEAIEIGIKILEKGGTSLDAVEKVINYFEDDSLFNAGKGAVFTHDGHNELDASIMDGKTLNAGAVAGVTRIKNPISAARLVMEKSKHVLLSGEGANQFAESQGLTMVENSYFFTQKNYDRLQKILNEEKEEKNDKHGTVGCVALDKEGNLAAATSTGGMSNKMYGRIGDSPIIGAGTYANNNTCAISCTGHGEFFIRYAVAHDVSALMEYKNLTLKDAVNEVIHNKLEKVDGRGGLIAIDAEGNISLQFNTPMMFRASYKEGGEKLVKIFE